MTLRFLVHIILRKESFVVSGLDMYVDFLYNVNCGNMFDMQELKKYDDERLILWIIPFLKSKSKPIRRK